MGRVGLRLHKCRAAPGSVDVTEVFHSVRRWTQLGPRAGRLQADIFFKHRMDSCCVIQPFLCERKGTCTQNCAWRRIVALTARGRHSPGVQTAERTDEPGVSKRGHLSLKNSTLGVSVRTLNERSR
ncbi:hypothetical protein MG293_014349 [Ovis ammon polii]|uniref:Uncharacterized protein n=1 Tax=Ovis ammon polii TaxID=230172 RepID=A0AAD4Y5B6_OVIAM|nr:hypothetical protein MG293_014349 [Ovis ammon polii]